MFFLFHHNVKHLHPLFFFIVFWHITVFAFRAFAFWPGILVCVCLYLCVHLLILLASASFELLS